MRVLVSDDPVVARLAQPLYDVVRQHAAQQHLGLLALDLDLPRPSKTELSVDAGQQLKLAERLANIVVAAARKALRVW